MAGLVGDQELAVAALQEQVVRAEQPHERLVRRVLQRGEVGVEDARTVPVDLDGVLGHRAFTSRTVESRNAAACFGVSGPSRCRSPRSRSTGPSSLSSARSRFPTWPAGQRGMRRTTGGEVSGSSSSPACSAASRNGISYMWVAWQPGHQRRYGSVISRGHPGRERRP